MAGYDALYDLELIMDRNLHRALAACRTPAPVSSSCSQGNSAAELEQVADAVLEDEDEEDVAGA